MASRDNSLDYLKGVGCLLMVLTHTQIHATGAVVYPLAAVITFLARFAPMLFFSASGVVNGLQARRHPLRYYLIFASVFWLFGVSYNAIWRPQVLENPVNDILQFAAMAIVAVVLVQKYARNTSLWYGILAAAAAAVHFLVRPLLPEFPLRQFVMLPPHDSGVYPLLPWIAFPFMGNIAYKLSDRALYRTAFALAGVSVAGLLGTLWLAYAHLAPFWFDKYRMPVGYFLLSLSVQFLLFAATRRWNAKFSHPLVLYVGRNSLAFLFLHLIYRNLFIGWEIFHPFIVWPSVLVLTVISIWALDWLNARTAARVLTSPYAWGALLLLLAVAAYLSTPTPVPAVIGLGLMRAVGLLFAFNYRGLSQVVKGMTEKAAPAGRPVEAAA